MRTHVLIGAIIAHTLFASGLWAQITAAPPEPPAPLTLTQPAAPVASGASGGTAPAGESNPSTTPAPAAEPAKSPLNFKDAEMAVVLKYISDKTGKPIISSGGIDKKVTLINPRAQTDAENLKLLYKILSTMGIAVVDTGDLIMVMPLADARESQIPIVSEKELAPGTEEIMTYTRRLRFSKVKSLVDLLKPMVRDGDALTYDEGSNSLFYTDTRSYVQRLSELVDMVDKEPHQEIQTQARAIRNASATALLEPCQQFLKTYATLNGSVTPETVIRVDPSLNTLVMRGPARELEVLGTVLDRLDSGPRRERPLETRRRAVNHVNAQELLKSAEAFLRRLVLVGGTVGDAPRTSLNYEPLTREIIMRGPDYELDALEAVLNELDKPVTSRSRKVNYADPDIFIKDALSLLNQDYAAEGRPGFRHSITWKHDPFNPSMILFRGPSEELDRLFPILDQIDKPSTTQNRRFFRKPEEIFPEALNLLVDQYHHDGIPKFRHSITWRRDPLNPINIIIKGPAEELSRLMVILDQLDKPLVERTRPIYSATPEVFIPAAIERMVRKFEDEGLKDYRASITWKREEFNPSILVIKGPPAELDSLFPILDLLDKPLSVQQRIFNNRTPEEVFPRALDLLVRQYADEGRPGYIPSVTWKKDPLNPSLVNIKAPAEEITRLSALLERLDTPTTERIRRFYDTAPEEVIPEALEIVVQKLADAGQAGYQPLTEWKKDELNPSQVILKAPATELDLLMPILDQLDKPIAVQDRRFHTLAPAEGFARALELVLRQYEEEGQPNYRHSLSWKQDPLDPSIIHLRGPQEELALLVKYLDQIDKPLIERTRQFFNNTPDTLIPAAIERLVAKKAENGFPGYKPTITWKREEFNPSVIIIKGPPEELDLLFPILENLDRPLVVSSRVISYGTAEEVIPLARERLKQHFVDIGRPQYEPVTTYRVDPLNGNLVMTGPQEEITALTTVLSEIDVPRSQTTNITLQEFPLGVAQPADLISAASEYLARRVALEGKRGDKPNVTYQVNPLTRSITLRGPATQLAYVTQIMKAVEQNTRRGQKPLIVYPEQTTVTQLYADLSQWIVMTFPPESSPGILQIPRLDALVISARPEDEALIRNWIRILDQEGAEQKVLRMVPIENSIPTTISNAIRTLIPSSSGIMYPDDTASRILIRDTSASIEKMVGYIKELDQPIEGQDIILEVKNLKSANPYYAYNALNEFSTQLAQFRGKPKTKARVIFEPTSSSILFFGKKEDVKELISVAEKLDHVALADTKPQIIQLKNAQATQVYSQLSQLLPTITNKQNPPVIIPDARLNSLLIAASPGDATRVTEIIKGLDAQGGDEISPKIIKLENAEVSYLYSTISQLITGAGKVLPDYRSNSLIILDSTANVQRLMPFIEQLDSAEGTEDMVLEIFKSESASIYYLYYTITEYASRLAAKKGKSRTKSLVQYDPYTSNLILMGDRNEVKELIELAKKLDKVALADAKPTFISLKNSRADMLASRLSSLLPDLTSRQNPPKILPDTRLNLLIVAASPDDTTKVLDLVKALDVSAVDTLGNRLVKLENAEASMIASSLQPLLSEAGKMIPDYRTNSVLILDSTESINRVLPFIEKFDTAESRENLIVKVLQMKTPNVYAIYNPLSTYASQLAAAKGTQTRSRPQVIVEPSTQSVIVIGRSADVDDILRMAEELDKLQWQGQEPVFIRIENAIASTVASSLRIMMPSIAKGGASAQIVADDRINVLLVLAQPSDLEKIKDLAAKLDIEDSGDLISRIIPLKSAPAYSVYSPLMALKSPRGLVTYDTNSNSLIIRDTSASMKMLEGIIHDLDTADATSEWVTEVRTLRQIDPSYLVQTLSQLSTQMSLRKGKSRPQSFAYAEPTSGSIILVGVTEELKPAIDLIERLEAAGKVGGKLRLFFLKYTRAQTLANQLRQVFQSYRQSPGAAQTTVISDVFTNSIIGIGSEIDLQRLDELIVKLDIPNAAGLEVGIFPLDGVSASLLSTNLEALSGPQGKLFSDTTSNSLVVIDTRDVIQRISKVVSELSEKGGGITTRVRKLEYGVSSSMVSPINQFLQLQSSRQGRTTPRAGVYAETSTNAVVIFGPTDEVNSIESLITQLDTEELSGRTPKIFTLRYVQAVQLASQMAQLIASSNLGGVRPVAVAEPNTNSLIVVAAERDMKRIEEVLKQIDIPEAGGLETRVYQLEHSSADNLSRNLTPPIISVRGKVFAEPGTNALVVTDTPESHDRVKKFIDQVDLGRGAVISKVRRLENTSVSTLTSPLQQFITHQAQTKGLTRPLTEVMSDPVSNSVIIYGPTEEVESLLGLLDQLDAESLFEREPKIIPLKRAQAARIAPILEQLLSLDRRGANAPRVVADSETNSLIVMAPKADLLRAEELLVTLDQTEVAGIETRIFRLKNADAQALAASVRPIVGVQARLFADVPSNSIVFTDTPANIETLAKLIEQLDTAGEDLAGMVTRVIPLRNTSAPIVDNTLSEFAAHIALRKGRSSRPLTRVTSETSTNSVVIIGPTDEVSQLTKLLSELDKDDLREREPHTYFLQNAQASQVAVQIQQVMSQISMGPNAARIVPIPDNNALLVLANPADRDVIERVLKTLDTPEGGLQRVHLYRLKHADPTQLVQSLRTTMSQTAAIAAHPESNSIIFADTQSNVDQLFKIIKELDKESRPEDLVSEVISLQNSKAGAISQPLQTIISQINAQRIRRNKPPLQSFADPDANSVVIVGASDDVAPMARIVRELDAESLSERKPEVFFLEYARASDMANEIRQLFVETSRLGAPSRVVADEWANALLVIADPRDMDWIRRLIKELDTREGRKRVVEIFVLENADASVLSERLQGLFVPGSGTGSRSRRPSYYDDYFGGRRSETLTEGQVTIIADQRLNALIVTAEPQDMSQVADLIDALDIQAPNLEGPVVYHIENGEAETLAQTLESLFSDTSYQGGYYYPVERDTSISGLSGKVRVIAEPTTNSIIVLASSPRAFDVVEKMLKELDRPSVQSGRTNIIPVKHALAQDLKKLLTDLFKPEDNAGAGRRRFLFDDFFGGGMAGGAGGGSFSNLIGKVRIEADTRTNSLLVITPDLYRPSVENLISALDAPTSQVLLETLIVEVTLGDDCDQGIQWGVDPTTGEVGKVAISNREVLTFDNDRSDFFDPNEFGNSVFNTAAENLQFFSLNQTQFQAVINFLQSNRNLNVQSRPGILTENNRKATVRVGTRTPTISNITVTNNTTSTEVAYEELGLTLEVTPHINSATMVTLTVNLKDGAIDPTIPPLAGTAYTFTDREFVTQLKVTNHHTAILAGVISQKESSQVHQVPFLHRLPVVGNKVFTNTAHTTEKVELLTFITPYILNSRADVIMATEMTKKKSRSPALRNLDMENGDWPEVFVDEHQNDPWAEVPKQARPPQVIPQAVPQGR